MTNPTVEDIENFVYNYLESDDVESLLEYFDVTVEEMIILLFQAGHIDEDLIK